VSVGRRLSPEASERSERSWRRGTVQELRTHTAPLAFPTSCGSSTLAWSSRTNSHARPSQAIRVHHPERETPGPALRQRHGRSPSTPLRAQCGPESVDGAMETMVHRRLRRVSDRAGGGSLRAVPEVRLGAGLCEAALQIGGTIARGRTRRPGVRPSH